MQPTDRASPPRRTRWRRPHTASWSIGVVLALAVGGVVVADLAGWPFLRKPAERRLSQLVGSPVHLEGDFRLQWVLARRLEIERVRIDAWPGTKAPHLVQAHGLALQWRWRDLWRAWRGGPLHLEGVSASRLDMHIVRTADGQQSWNPAWEKRKTGAGDARRLPLTVGRLVLGEGRLHVDDAVREIRADVNARLAAVGQSPWPLTVEANGAVRGLPFEAAAQAAGVLPLFDTDAKASLLPVRLTLRVNRTRVAFAGTAASLLSGARLRGRLDVAGPSLQAVGRPVGLTLPATPAFELQAWVAHEDRIWSLVTDNARIGTSRLTAAVQFDRRREPARLAGRVRGSRLSFADLGPSVGTDQKRQRPGRVLPDSRIDVPALSRMDALVDIAFDELVFNTNALAPLRDLQTQLQLAGGVLTLRPLQARVAGGRLSGQAALDARTATPALQADLRLDGVDAAAWLRGLPRGPGTTRTAGAGAAGGRALPWVTGRMDAHARLQASGHSAAEMLGRADGDLTLDLRDGGMSHLLFEIAGLDVAQALGVAVRGDRLLPYRCARLQGPVRRGVFDSRVGVVDSSDSTLRLTGRVDLAQETLQGRLESRPKDFSPLSLRTPVLLAGTLGEPRLSLEPRRLAGRAAAAVVLGVAVAPLAALVPFIDTGEKVAGDPCAGARDAPAARPTSRPVQRTQR